MATAYIREYQGIGNTFNVGGIGPSNLPTQGPQEPGVDQPALTINPSTTPSQAFGATTQLIRVHVDAVCSFVIGPPGTVATTSNARMAQNQTEYFSVKPGHIFAVISNT